MKKTFIASLVILIAVCLSLDNKSYGQATISADTIKSMLIKDWERAKSYTQEYMNSMPPSKYSFRAIDSVRTFAQQLLHLADANMFFMSIVTGAPSPFSGVEKRTGAQTADSARYFVNASYDYVIDQIRKMPAASLGASKTFNMGRAMTESTLTFINKAFEHQTHHRGQTTIYIRLAGIRPPQERLF